MRLIIIIHLILCSPLSPALWGQAVSQFKASLEREVFEESTLIKGYLDNPLRTPQRLEYRFTIQIGEEKEVRSSPILVRGRTKVALLKATAFFTAGDFDLIKLEIFQKEQLVAADSITVQMIAKENQKLAAKPQKKSSQQATTFSDLEIDGLIIDETRSKVAHNFYEYFYNKWNAPRSVKNYLILIRELPSRGGLAARIAIEINGEKVVERQLQPRDEVIEQTAGQLVSAIQRHLEKQQSVQQELNNGDLSGSGIY